VKRLVLIGIIFVFVTGCGRHTYWMRDDFSQEQFMADAYECTAQSHLSVKDKYPGQDPYVGPYNNRRIFAQCLRHKGYKAVTKRGGPPELK
jgi:hypothetical protein